MFDHMKPKKKYKMKTASTKPKVIFYTKINAPLSGMEKKMWKIKRMHKINLTISFAIILDFVAF